MDPIAVTLFGVNIYWYSLLLVLGFVLGYFILIKLAREKGIKKTLIERYFFWFVISVVVGARLFEILFYSPAHYFSNPVKIFYVWEGGIASHGAILGVIFMTWIFCKKHGLRMYQLLDLVVIPAAIGAMFVRIGNFVNSELVGKVSDGGWRHPVQIYQVVTNGVLAIILFSMRKVKEGVLTWSFIGLYSLFRFITEFWKDLPLGYGTGWIFNVAQWLSLIGIGLSIYFLWKIRSK